jgi:hypothetical protein
MESRKMGKGVRFTLVTLVSIVIFACSKINDTTVILYDAPQEESVSSDYEMYVNGKQVFVYQARASKYPINQIWPGYQRPIEQTEIVSFSYFDFEGEVEINIIPKRKIETVEVRPLEFGIQPIIEKDTITIRLTQPSQIIVEVNGYNQALHVFANPIPDYDINIEDPKVHYFGPGIHDVGVIDVKSDETVYIEGGAIVYGVIHSKDAQNVQVLGRGILDASKIARNETGNMIKMNNVSNIQIDGIIFRDPHFWTALLGNCNEITFNNVKLIGLWRYNSDGINLVNSKNVTIKNSFIRSFDDNIVVRGSKSAYIEPYNIIENIHVYNCVLWNDWGRVMEIGADTFADTIKNISYTNIYIPHFTSVVMDIQNCDRGYVTDIHYENIYIEDPINDSLIIGTTPIVKNAWGKTIVLGVYESFYSGDTIRGKIDNITFKNIYNKGKYTPVLDPLQGDSIVVDKNSSFKNYDLFIRDNIYYGDIKYNVSSTSLIYLSGFDASHEVSNIHIENFQVNGEEVLDLNTVGKNQYVRNVFLK